MADQTDGQMSAGPAPATGAGGAAGAAGTAWRPLIGGARNAGRLTFSTGAETDSLVFVSGMTATNDDGELLAPGDIAGQTRVILEKIRRLLEAASCRMEDVVMTRDYIVSTENYKATAAVRREVFGDAFPAATGVVVAGLLRPGALIEIEAIAVKSGR